MNTSVAVLPDSVVVGTSARMHAVFEFLRVIGTSESTVLVTGESGTGKEVTATLIHTAPAASAAHSAHHSPVSVGSPSGGGVSAKAR